MKKFSYPKALQDSNHLLDIESTNVGALYIRGCALEKLGNVDGAIEDYTKVLEFDPHHANALFARGACLNKKGDFVQAIEDYNIALQIDGEKQKTKRQMLRTSNFKDVSSRNSSIFNPESTHKIDEDFVNPNENETNFLKLNTSQILMPQPKTPSNFADTTKSLKTNINTLNLQSESKDPVPLNPIKAEQLHAQGFEARKAGDFQTAIDLYTQALSLQPQHFKSGGWLPSRAKAPAEKFKCFISFGVFIWEKR